MIEVEHRSFETTLARAAELGGADLVFTSPPYPTVDPAGKGREGAPPRQYGGDTPRDFLWDDYQRLGDCCFSALKPGGFCIVVVDGPVRFWRSKRIGSERSLIAFKLAIDWAERVGFRYVEHEVYSRLGPPGDFHPRRRSGFEPMHVFQRSGKRGHFDAWAAAAAAKTAGQQRTDGPGSLKWSGRVYRGTPGRVHTQAEKRTLTTVVEATKKGPAFNGYIVDRDHPAPFTPHLADTQVLSYSPRGGLVCDPFNGSGTTGIAAAKHSRRFVGGDLGARERDGRRWADIGRERAEDAAREFAAQVAPVSPSVGSDETSRQPGSQTVLF